MGEKINRLITGYMDATPPGGPRDAHGWSENPETGERKPLRSRAFATRPVSVSEQDAARLAYVEGGVGAASDDARQALLERLVSAAIGDALTEYARQAGKGQQEVMGGLLEIQRYWREHGIRGE